MNYGLQRPLLILEALTLILFVALLSPQHCAAESPLVAAQQAKYQLLRKVWEADYAPKGLDGPSGAQPGAVSARNSGTGRVAMMLSNVDFEYTAGIGFWVKELVLTLEPKKAGAPIDLDHVEAFTIHIQRGEIVARSAGLSALFNKYLLAGSRKPLRDVRITVRDGEIAVDANVALLWLLGIWLPASFSGSMTLTADNKLEIDIHKVSAFGFSLNDLMKALGLSATALVKLDRPGIELHGSSIVLDHRAVFPLPHLDGNIGAAKLRADGLHLSFENCGDVIFLAKPSLGSSYIWIESGDPKFFGSVVTNARIAIFRKSEGANLYFNLYNYRKQFAAGEARIAADGLLTIQLP
jgi:hypothetical protein